MAGAPVTHDELSEELARLEGKLTRVFEEKLDDRMRALEERLDDRMHGLEDRLVERTRDMQTEIIRVFMEFQARNEDRDALQEKSVAVLGERVASVERRLRQIEAKLLLEPPAA